MTQKLVDLFNLAQPVDINDHDAVDSNNDAAQLPHTPETLSTLEKIERALPQVRGLEASDAEMDELAALAVNSYKDLIDLGQQVDSRFSSEILAVAATMLGHAITAKVAKTNKRIKMIELQLKKAALDQRAAEKTEQIDAIPLGEGKAFDRNELLRMMNTRASSNSASK